MILLNDFKQQWNATCHDAMTAFEAIGRNGWYILGSAVAAFEEDLARYWRVDYAAGVASGLDAIQIALHAAGCKAGDYVLTTPVSAFATTLAILRLGAIPVFVDIDSHGLIDLDLAEQLLASRSDIRYFLPVHLFGHACDLDHFGRLRERYGVVIIEDCAQSIGAKWKNTPTGTVGLMACTSFYPTKNLGCLGDGGAILTNSDQLYSLVRILRDYGQSNKYKHDIIGWNSRLDEMQAAYLSRVALPRLETWIEQRRAVAEAYLSGIRNPFVSVVGGPKHSNSCWHLFPLLIDSEKQAFRTHLHSWGVQTSEHYPVSIPDQRALNTVRVEIPWELSKSSRFCRSEVSIPIHPFLTTTEVSTVIDAVNSWKG